ncbi:hypothetical protein EZV73_02885 [Acidaminobacter sp. JC074]|uniref:WD40 repeat domain-containing protein n=1 Tax=Acidaminobacter sp. JC074 TaxID=2530199 RepID=UPI001F0F19DA|nr:hypothetical protein [Acidaminobacter sp. JC074]MCH4886493.1 hypothetical protein [Acidaminobacter sp. JC074]
MKKVLLLLLMICLIGCQSESKENTVIEEEIAENIIDYGGIRDFVNVFESHQHADRIYTSDSNEDYIVIGSTDGSISLWDHSGQLIHHKSLYTKGVEEVEIHNAIYSISDDNQLIKTDLESFDSLIIYEGITKEFNISNDLSYVAISDGNSVKVFDLSSFELISSFDWTSGCFDVRFGPNNDFIYCVGHEGKVEKYNIMSGQVVMNYKGLSFDVHCLEITEDGAYLVAGGTDSNVAIWKEDGSLIKKYRHMDGLYDLAISLDEKYVASVGVDKSVNIVELENGKHVKRINFDDELHTVTFTSDGLVTGGYDDTVYFIGNKVLSDLSIIGLENLDQVEELKVISAHNQAGFCLALSHDDKIVATSSFDKTLKLWHVKSGRLLDQVQVDEMAVDMVFTDDDQTLIYKGEQGKLYFYDLEGKTMSFVEDQVGSISLSNDNKKIVIGKIGGNIKLCTYPDLDIISNYQALDYPIFQLAFSNDDSKVFFAYAGATDDFTTTALDAKSFEKLYSTRGHDGYNYDIKVSDKYLITCGADHNIAYWDIHDGNLNKLLDDHSGKVMDVFISRDKSWMVSCSAHGRTMRLWDFQSGKLIKTFRPGTEVQGVVISKDETYISTIGVDGKVRIYGIE